MTWIRQSRGNLAAQIEIGTENLCQAGGSAAGGTVDQCHLLAFLDFCAESRLGRWLGCTGLDRGPRYAHIDLDPHAICYPDGHSHAHRHADEYVHPHAYLHSHADIDSNPY